MTNPADSAVRKPRARTFRQFWRATFSHATNDRYLRALLGTVFPEPPEPTEDIADSDALLTQAKDIYDREREIAAETRRRGEQLLTRIVSVAPLVVGVLAAASRSASATGRVATALSVIALIFLAISFLAIRNNLGKETHYEPLCLGDIACSAILKMMERRNLIRDFVKASRDSELRNNDAIDRQHFAFGMWVWAVLFFLVAAGLALSVLFDASAPPACEPKPNSTETQRTGSVWAGRVEQIG